MLVALAFPRSPLPLGFPKGWGNATLIAERRAGAPVARVASGVNGFVFTSREVERPPTERELRFTVWLRSKADRAKPVVVRMIAMDARGGGGLGEPSAPVTLKAGVWTRGTVDFVADERTAKLTLEVDAPGGDAFDVSAPELKVGGIHVLGPFAEGGLLRASAGTPAVGTPGVVEFPIPGPTAEQAPLSFALRCTPDHALKDYVIRQRSAGNWVCEARISPPKGGKATLRWDSLVAVRDRAPDRLPRATIGPADPVHRPWLAATPVVQADDPKIQAKAAELRKEAPDLETFVRHVVRFTSENRGTGAPFVALDARSALTCDGSCTSRANLGAALLRAGGVPARTVSILAVVDPGELMYQHWLAEYWHPGAGWVRLETTENEVAPRATEYVTLATASIEDERLTGRPGQFGWLMPGAAWMSGIQGTPGLYPIGTEVEGNSNWSHRARRLDVDDALFDAARAAWPRLARGHPELDAAALEDSPAALIARLKRLG